MATLLSIKADLRLLHSKMGSNAKKALYAESSSLVGEFQQRSPVDSGRYRSMWRVSRDRFSSGGSLASVSIHNQTPRYGVFMEFGAGIGEAPWHYPSKKKKKSGKLAVSDGRVWAGGLNPGHSKTVGGAIGAGLFNNNHRLFRLTTSIANAVMGAI